MEAILQIIGSILAVFLPALITWISDKAAEKNQPETFEEAQNGALSDLATALNKGDADAIAAAFAKHGRNVPLPKKRPSMPK